MDRTQVTLSSQQAAAIADMLREDEDHCVLCHYAKRPTWKVEGAAYVRLSCPCNLFVHESCQYTHIGKALLDAGANIPISGAETRFGKFINLVLRDVQSYPGKEIPTVRKYGIICPNCSTPLGTETQSFIEKKMSAPPGSDVLQKFLDQGVRSAILCHEPLVANFWIDEGGKLDKNDPGTKKDLTAMAKQLMYQKREQDLLYSVAYLGAEVTGDMQRDLNDALAGCIKTGKYEEAENWILSGTVANQKVIETLQTAQSKAKDAYVQQKLDKLSQMIKESRDRKGTYEKCILMGDYQSAGACIPTLKREDLSEQASKTLDTQFNNALQQGQLEAAKAWYKLGARSPQADKMDEFVAAKNWGAIKTTKECGLEIPYQIQERLSVELVGAININDSATAKLLFDIGARIPKEQITELQSLLVNAALDENYDKVLELKNLGVAIDETTQSVLDQALKDIQSIPGVETIAQKLKDLGAKAPPPEQIQLAEAAAITVQGLRELREDWLQKFDKPKAPQAKPQAKPSLKTVEKKDCAADVKQEQMIEELTTAVRRRKKEDVRVLKDQGVQINNATLKKLMDIVRQWTTSREQSDWQAELDWRALLEPLLKP